ncbi:HemK2/MTQ2 family protein methyltransferase [Mycolicibacter kumamotonensis]|uniref:Methylase n=1 Tax=Mycolicibacter kumamotonensis TaxID=354243 RepID=A0A1B8SD24_9MYCO|nr:HemK2/MTQ2 family protein methyltransferase [Mycolicibacter kumamotonensis]NDJ90648.1 methyltransferase [Mycolicibacter kumamotonensis]OBY30639.1 methylase [Mycolicibacter kumamotonensis]ORA83133.1 methylase [Mycolicibacter kumamotonensis]
MPQQDSHLLIDTMEATGLAGRGRVLDLCTGSGVVAIAAAEMGADSVTAFDICPRAVRCSRDNARAAGADVEIRHGPWTGALACDPFDLVVSNPPYVPSPRHGGPIPAAGGPEWSWNGGVDGRIVLDPLCRSAAALLRSGGSVLLVQSALADPGRSLKALRDSGLDADIVASRWIPFGPVVSARAGWLERTGRMPRGCREEQLVVIRADKP